MKKLKPILLAAAALGGLALMAAAALLDLPGGITGLMCGMGGALLGLGGSSVIMGAVERHMSPQERKELQRSETDERNIAIREKAAQSSWYWTLYLLWVPFVISLVREETLWILLSSAVTVLHCVFHMVNMGRWAKKLEGGKIMLKTTGRGPDYGKNLIQRRWAFLALLAVGATGLVCYFFLVPGSGISGHARGFYLGGASGITGAALANLLRNEWMLRHPERWKKARIQETDERSQRLTAQAAQLAGVATFFLQALAAFVLVAVDPMLVKVLLGSMLAYILFFLGARAALARRR